jgi:hypothetical protein
MFDLAVAGEFVVAAVWLYAAYWAFSVRKALAGRMYRRHALLLGVVGVLVAVVTFLTYSTNPAITDLISIYTSALFILLFAFIDSTVPVARRSDPLLRSILGWDRLRVVLWIDAAALGAANTIPSFLPSNSEIGNLLSGVLWLVFALPLFGVSGAALVIGGRRSRDPIFRRSLRWMGLVLIMVVAVFVDETLISSLPWVTEFEFYYSAYGLPAGVLSAIAGYFLYRSARSLAPISSLTEAEPGPLPQVGTA